MIENQHQYNITKERLGEFEEALARLKKCEDPLWLKLQTDALSSQISDLKEQLQEFKNKEAQRISKIPPVDRSKRTLTDGSPVTADHKELKENGQQKGYVVLSADERAKGYVRPVRRSYIHNVCGAITTMGIALAETYARDPKFYGGTFCCKCGKHFDLDQFVWDGTNEQVGS